MTVPFLPRPGAPRSDRKVGAAEDAESMLAARAREAVASRSLYRLSFRRVPAADRLYSLSVSFRTGADDAPTWHAATFARDTQRAVLDDATGRIVWKEQRGSYQWFSDAEVAALRERLPHLIVRRGPIAGPGVFDVREPATARSLNPATDTPLAKILRVEAVTPEECFPEQFPHLAEDEREDAEDAGSASSGASS